MSASTSPTRCFPMLACVKLWRLPGSRFRAQLHFRRKIRRIYVDFGVNVAVAVVGVVVAAVAVFAALVNESAETEQDAARRAG